MDDLELDAPVAYEPCTCFRADGDAEVCADCGWAEDDHVVVAIGPAPALPRAS